MGADGGAQPAAAAEITASAFRIAPERPLLGRVLDESDERAGAAPVVVLGHDVWTERFDRDPQIVGRTVQLGSGFATVVGVMPEGYAFPMAHELWLPLRTDVAGLEPRGGVADHRLRPPRARHDVRERAGGADGVRQAARRGASDDARAAPAARDSVRAGRIATAATCRR